MSKAINDIVLKVLESFADGQVNLGSSAARERIATKITEKLKKNGTYTEYGDDELEEQKAKKVWVCQTCGKSTFETEDDYLVHPKLHLGCALEEELNGTDIKTQYHEASSLSFKQKTT